MTSPIATIRGTSGAYAILLGTKIMAYATSFDSAAARANHIEARAKITPRACLCCGSKFNSAHKGNRLCRKCKDAA